MRGAPRPTRSGRSFRRRAKTTAPRGRLTAGGSPSTGTWSRATTYGWSALAGASDPYDSRSSGRARTPASRIGVRTGGRSPSAVTARRSRGTRSPSTRSPSIPLQGARSPTLSGSRSTGSRALPWELASRRTARGWLSTDARSRTDASPFTRCRQRVEPPRLLSPLPMVNPTAHPSGAPTVRRSSTRATTASGPSRCGGWTSLPARRNRLRPACSAHSSRA